MVWLRRTPLQTAMSTVNAAKPLRVMTRKPQTANTTRINTPVLPSAVKSRIISSTHLGPIGSARLPGVRRASRILSSKARVPPSPTASASLAKARSAAAAAMTVRSVTRSMRLTWSMSALACDCSRNLLSSVGNLGMADHWPGVGRGQCRGGRALGLAIFLSLADGLDEQLPIAVNEPKALGRIQRFEQSADDADVGKLIAGAAVGCRCRGRPGGNVRRHGFAPCSGRCNYPIGFAPPALFRREQPRHYPPLRPPMMNGLTEICRRRVMPRRRYREAPDEEPHGQAGAPAEGHGDARGFLDRGRPGAGAGSGRVPRQDRVRLARPRHARLD